MTLSHYASPQKRVFAKVIDLLLVVLLGQLPLGSVGSILGFLYSVVADAFPSKKFQAQSLGKRILRIRVVHGNLEKPARMDRLKVSVVRNAPVGIVTFLMIIPVWGWILSLLIGVPFFLIELSLMIKAERRQRLGDVMAESVVLDCE